MQIRPATIKDCYAIAELALMAGEGIPAYFWGQSRQGGEDILAVGARNAGSETENFSYTNAHLAIIENEIAGMLLAYRLPDADQEESLEEYPAFIRPLIELEQCVPGSFYINMLAVYPKFRNQHVGTALMAIVERLAREHGCDKHSVEVFEQNGGALRLYERLGYTRLAQRDVVPHPCHPYTGTLILLTKEVSPLVSA